jgi:hypothetical protein
MKPIEERIQEICEKSALNLVSNYKPLTNEGKVEVLIFTSLISMFQIQTRVFGANYNNITDKIYQNLMKEIKPYKPELSRDQIGYFINKRFEAYSGEIQMIFEGLGYNILTNTFYYFYVKPLTDTLPSSPDISQIIMFTKAMIDMANNAFNQFEELEV